MVLISAHGLTFIVHFDILTSPSHWYSHSFFDGWHCEHLSINICATPSQACGQGAIAEEKSVNCRELVPLPLGPNFHIHTYTPHRFESHLHQRRHRPLHRWRNGRREHSIARTACVWLLKTVLDRCRFRDLNLQTVVPRRRIGVRQILFRPRREAARRPSTCA
jgi:hypothetical protein